MFSGTISRNKELLCGIARNGKIVGSDQDNCKTERANLLGDIPALFLVAFVLWYLMPKSVKT